MDKINIRELAKQHEGEFVSIYLPTHISNPENQQDRIRFKNLLTKAEVELKERNKVDVEKFLKDAWKLQSDLTFWNGPIDGLAVLISKDGLLTYRTMGTMPERVVVDDRFHLLPLLNYYEFMDDSYLLDISKDRFKLFHGGRQGIQEVEIPELINRFDELFDDKDTQSSVNQGTGGEGGIHVRSTATQIDDKETEKFMRYVVAGMTDFLKEKDERIILFGTTENVAYFTKLAEGHFKIAKVIDKPLSSINLTEVFNELKTAMQPDYIKTMEERLNVLNNSIGEDKGTDNLSLIEKEAENGRIETLFLSSYIDGVDIEKLDKLVYDVYAANGEVVLIDEKFQEFPKGAGAAFRY